MQTGPHLTRSFGSLMTFMSRSTWTLIVIFYIIDPLASYLNTVVHLFGIHVIQVKWNRVVYWSSAVTIYSNIGQEPQPCSKGLCLFVSVEWNMAKKPRERGWTVCLLRQNDPVSVSSFHFVFRRVDSEGSANGLQSTAHAWEAKFKNNTAQEPVVLFLLILLMCS